MDLKQETAEVDNLLAECIQLAKNLLQKMIDDETASVPSPV